MESNNRRFIMTPAELHAILVSIRETVLIDPYSKNDADSDGSRVFGFSPLDRGILGLRTRVRRLSLEVCGGNLAGRNSVTRP